MARSLLGSNYGPFLVRTNFSDDTKWRQLCIRANEPVLFPGELCEFMAGIEFFDDTAFKDLEAIDIIDSISKDYGLQFFLVADEKSFTCSRQTVLCFNRENKQSFRLAINDMWEIDNNLAESNTDWEDYYQYLDEDGVYKSALRELHKLEK